MEVFDQLKQRNEQESELLLQQNTVRTLQATIEALQGEIKQSRLDVLNAERIVSDLTQQVTNQEAEMQKRESEFESQLQEKDEIIQLKTQALEELSREALSDFQQTPSRETTFKIPQTRTALYEENVDLRRKLSQKQNEIDLQIQKYNELLKEIRQRPFHTNLEQEQYIQEQEEKLIQLESQLREEQMRVNSLNYERNQLVNRSTELDRQNTMLIAQFSDQFLPCYYNENTTEDEMRQKMEDIQQIIQTNIRLQQIIEDLESNRNEELPTLSGGSLKFELDQAKVELDQYKRDIETANSQIRRLQTSVEFYKMKYEELEENQQNGVEPSERAESGRSFTKRGRFEDGELSRVRTELSATSSRLNDLIAEKERREKAFDDLVSQKNELIVQLHASKEALELKVQTQSTVLEDMEKRLNEIDKTNRKLDEQRIKIEAEHSAVKSNLDSLQSRFDEIESENRKYLSTNQDLSTELEAARCELAELRVKCETLAENENISQTISQTLDEFRDAYLQMDNAQLEQTKEQLETVRKDNETMSNYMKAMNVQQLFAMDKLKATLADAQLQRETYAQECTTLKQKINALQLEHDELNEKHNTLSQQLVDIDTSDATLESCRKQIQQLRNKISYLEKTVAETNARAEKWNVQLGVSQKECKTLKEITENLEKALHESEEKALRESNRLEEQVNASNSLYRGSQNKIESLRAEITALQTRFSTREAELEHEVAEWKSKLNEIEQEKLSLKADLDRLNGELLSARNHEQELEASVTQKQIEVDDLIQTKNALDDACSEKENIIGECRNEIQTLQDKLTNSDTVLVEVRQALQTEIESLQQKISILEKAQFDDQGNRQSVLDNVNQMLNRIADETDQLPLVLPDMSNAEQMGKALEIIERMQREKKEEVNRRLQLIAEQQSTTISNPVEEMVPMREYNTVVTKLRGQIDAQSAEIQQKMQQIAELKILEGLRERCDLLEAELQAAKEALLEYQQQITNDSLGYQQKMKETNQKLMKAESDINGLRTLAKTYKSTFEKTSKELNEIKAKYVELEDKYKNAVSSAAVTTVQDPEQEEIEVVDPSNASTSVSTQGEKFKAAVAAKIQQNVPTTTPASTSQQQTPVLATTTASQVPQSTTTVQIPSAVSTSTPQLLTAEQRAAKFQARNQQNVAGTPDLKRKRPNEE